MLNKISILSLILIVATGFVVNAGSLIPTTPSPQSAEYTLSDIYQKLLDNLFTPSAHQFAPSLPPGPTQYTLEDIWGVIPSIDPTKILDSYTIMGITGEISESEITLSSSTTAISSGYYATTTLSLIDGDLKEENIKSGVEIFGLTGTLPSPNELEWETNATTTKMSKVNAIAYCNGLGASWRLPTAIEAHESYLYGIDDFIVGNNEYYWTSSAQPDNGSRTLLYSYPGRIANGGDDSYVRCVQ